MSAVLPKVFFGERLVDKNQANLSVASSAVLYGLSVYTVFFVRFNKNGYYAFRLAEHWQRLVNSAKIIGFTNFENQWNYAKFERAVRQLVRQNSPQGDVLVRASVHLNAELAGPRTGDLPFTLSLFAYEAKSTLPAGGARLRTSIWRRVSDQSIPPRAKVNGSYVNSALAKQDALASGYDDCVLLDYDGHVTELSTANIFIVRDDRLITPGVESDNLEGINRQTIIELAAENGLEISQRPVDLTELYIANEIFACGTSAFLSPVIEIDNRLIGNGRAGRLTKLLTKLHRQCLDGLLHPEWLNPI